MGDKELHDPQGAIELNPKAVKGRQDTYSSLTDLHGISVFTDEFHNQMEAAERQREMEEEELQQSFFVNEVNILQDKDEQLLSQMFTGQQETVLKPDYTKNANKISGIEIAMVFIAVFAVTAMYLFLFGDKKLAKRH